MKKKTRLKAILFDWDGTIADTIKQCFEGYSYVSKLGNRTYLSLADFKTRLSLTWERNFAYLGVPKKDYSKAYRLYNNRYCCHPIFLVPEMKKVVQDLAEKYEVAIVTNTEARLVKKQVLHHRLPVRKLIGPIKGKHKPNPAQLILAMKKLKVKPEECFYVGDMAYDIQAAHNAGIKAIALSTRYSFHPAERIRKAKPEFTARKPSDIIKIIRGL